MPLPNAVFPIHDPDGNIFKHLDRLILFLKQNFRNAFASVTPITVERFPSQIDRLANDEFFQLVFTPRGMQIGGQFKLLYQRAVSESRPDQILHLCYLDRLLVALEDEYRDQFLKDIGSIQPKDTPLIFHRSAHAWHTHPRNYFEIEGFVTTVSKHLYGRTIDFAWCYMAAQASQLEEIIPGLQSPDLSLVTELLLPLIEDVKTKDVDWLAWEDPLLFSRDPELLKSERENCCTEVQKRLGYVLPMIKLISDNAKEK